MLLADNESSVTSTLTSSAESDEMEGKILKKPRCIINNVRNLVKSVETAARELDKCTEDLTGIPQIVNDQIQNIKQMLQQLKAMFAALQKVNLFKFFREARRILQNLGSFAVNLTTIIGIVTELDNPDNSVGLQCVKTQFQALREPIRNWDRC